MKADRKIIVYIATSADGYIARPNGDVEWLNRRPLMLRILGAVQPNDCDARILKDAAGLALWL